MVSPRLKREALALMRSARGLSIRRACGLLRLHRSSFHYKSKRKRDDAPLKNRLLELASQRTRFGLPRLEVLLKRDGFTDNHKRIERIYRELGLSVRKRIKKRRGSGLRLVLTKPERPN